MKTVLLGRAGSGRTRRLLAEVVRRAREGTDDRAILLVPTYGRGEHLKRALLGLDEGLDGILDRSVLTFTALAERVLGGVPIAALATRGTRDLVLRAALERADAPAFARVRSYPGFRARLLALVKEVKESGLGEAEALDALAALAKEASGAAARARIESFAAVFRAYGEDLAAARAMDHEDFQRALLGELRDAAAAGRPARGLEGVEWFGVDGFVNFTATQREAVDLVAEGVHDAVLTLADDRARPDLFLPSADTLRHLLDRKWRVERLEGNRRAAEGAADLRRLEASLFAPRPPAPEPPDADGSVRLLACADPADEADRLARTAALWIRRDGWRPGEVLVILRSLAAARPLLEEAFRRQGIPLRVFAPRPLAAEPLARAALDLVRLALGRGDGETALRAVRSGLVAGTVPEESDRLAELAALRGVPATPAALREIARGAHLERTAALLDRLAPDEAPSDPAAAAQAILSVPGPLRPSFVAEPGTSVRDLDRDAAAADAAALGALRHLVAETARSLRGRPADPRAFLDALEGAAARASFTPEDRRLHAVNAVDAEEARHWEARGVLLGGLVERQFPRLPREDLLLRDRERERANAGRRLRFSLRLRSGDEERLLFYAAATRARERLVISWPVAGPDGARLLPSSFLDEVRRIWPEGAEPLSESRAADPAPVLGEETAPSDLLRGALPRAAAPSLPGSEGRARAIEAGALLDELARSSRGGRLPALAAAASRASDPEARLRRPSLRAPLLRPFRTSATALSAFHQCAYLHFAGHVLRLRSAARGAEEGLDPRRLGTVVHAALEQWFRGGLTEDPGALFDASLADGMAGIRPGLDDRATAARAREAVLAFCLSEGARVGARRWKPAAFEVPFGSGGRGEAGPLVLRAGGRRVEVRGRLDRLDRAPDGSAIAVDYKMRWKERPFDEKEFEKSASGEDPQPFVYWLALRDAFGMSPAGVEFAQVGARTVSGLRAADAPESVAPDEPRILDAEGAAAVERAVRDAAGRAAAALARGLVPARPSDPDRCGSGRCDFADLCRYEKWDPRRGG